MLVTAAASGAGTGVPLDEAGFARLMAPFAPFEAAPVLALAVSGGPDSLALLHLAAGWARAQGGAVVALTVDHGLRPEAAAEAAYVGGVAQALGVPHHVLTWQGAKPGGNIAAAARDARYGLLEAWCAGTGVLHLLTAHTRDDQAETVLLRLARGSGVSGLAAMSPATPLASVRLLRPLLDVPKARLLATLAACGQDWIDDPTNHDPAFARARLRGVLPSLASIGLGMDRLGETALVMARARTALHLDVARLLAEAVVLNPAGAALIRPAAFSAAPREIGLRALARVVAVVGGLAYPPRAGRVEHLLEAFAVPGPWRARTLGGCRLVAASGRARGRLLVHRELAALPPPVACGGDGAMRWDRFHLSLKGLPPGGVEVGALGGSGWLALRRVLAGVVAGVGEGRGPDAPPVLPAAVARSLPALRQNGHLLAVPSLDWRASGAEKIEADVQFAPPTALLR